MTMIKGAQRFLTSSSPCPICAGYERIKPGHGERCYGYTSGDGEWAFCTREEHAGKLDRLFVKVRGIRSHFHILSIVQLTWNRVKISHGR